MQSQCDVRKMLATRNTLTLKRSIVRPELAVSSLGENVVTRIDGGKRLQFPDTKHAPRSYYY